MNEKNENKKMTKCKACGVQIAKSAKACPQCGAKSKQHKALGITLMILGIIMIIGAIGGGDSEASTDPNLNAQTTTASKTAKQTEAPISYTAYTVDEMVKDLDENALRAEENTMTSM